jgi:hypothetical protein
MTPLGARSFTVIGRVAGYRRRLDGRVVTGICAPAAAIAVGVAASISPSAVLVAVAATGAIACFPSPSGRFGIVVLGGLLVMGSSNQLDPPKVAYLVWVAASTAVALAALGVESERPNAYIRPLLVTAAAVVAAILLGVVVALSAETPLIDSVRDAAPYGLLAVASIMAWDGARSRLGPHMEAVIVAAGILSSVGNAVVFVQRRGIADFPFDSFGLGSGVVSNLAFAAAIAGILTWRPRPFLRVIVAAVILTPLLLSGTRSVLVILVGPVAMVLAHRQRSDKARRLVGALIAVGLVVVLMVFLAGQVGLVDLVRLSDRIGSVMGIGLNFSTDQSYLERIMQLNVAASAFAGSPVTGVGLGFRFDWVQFSGEFSHAFTLDTSLAVAAKFGLIGLGLFGIAAAAGVSLYRRLRHSLPEHLRLTLLGFVSITIATLPLGNPLEDKGLGLAIAMLIAWALASIRTAGADPSTSTHRWSQIPRVYGYAHHVPANPLT